MTARGIHAGGRPATSSRISLYHFLFSFCFTCKEEFLTEPVDWTAGLDDPDSGNDVLMRAPRGNGIRGMIPSDHPSREALLFLAALLDNVAQARPIRADMSPERGRSHRSHPSSRQQSRLLRTPGTLPGEPRSNHNRALRWHRRWFGQRQAPIRLDSIFPRQPGFP